MAESDNRHRIGVDNDWFGDYSDDVSLTEAQVLLRDLIVLRYSFAVCSFIVSKAVFPLSGQNLLVRAYFLSSSRIDR